MQKLDCRSILDNRDASFYQLSAVINDVRGFLNSFRVKDGSIRALLFEVPQNLVVPLQKLDDLTTILFKETEFSTNDGQQMYLVHSKRLAATFYCYIQIFIKLHIDKNQSDPAIDMSEQTRKLAYEFYLKASYELRTPYNVFKLYTQADKYHAGTKGWREKVGQIYTSPFIPENQDKVEKISYWTDELGKFMNDLPRLWREFSDEDTA